MSTLTKLKENIESVIVGKGKVIDMVMTSLIARRSYSIGGRSWNGQDSYG